MRWPAVLEGEHVVARVVVAAEELTLAVLDLAPALQGGGGDPIDRDRLNGVLCLAACLIPRLSPHDHPIVMHGDIAGLEVYGQPLESAEPAAAYPGRQFHKNNAANRSS